LKESAMTYIHRAALDMIDGDLKRGYPYSSAVLNAACHWNIPSADLRTAHEKRAHRAEMANRASIAFLMLAVFASPVLFYFAAKV
jgi:hypothetical protein